MAKFKQTEKEKKKTKYWLLMYDIEVNYLLNYLEITTNGLWMISL